MTQTRVCDAGHAADASLLDLGLLDGPSEVAFDDITALASEVLCAPVALVSVIDDIGQRQFFKSQVGLLDPWASRRETPLTHSFCQHVRAADAPLVVSDARRDPLVMSNLAVEELNVIAYLGVPIHDGQNRPVGALCIIDSKPRSWSARDISHLRKLGRCVSQEISLRAARFEAEQLHKTLAQKFELTRRYGAMREVLCQPFMAPDLTCAQRLGALLRGGCEAFGMSVAAINRVSDNTFAPVYGHNISAKHLNAAKPLRGTLTSVVLGGGLLYFSDALAETCPPGVDALGQTPRCFAALPLEIGAVSFGTLELSSSTPRNARWNDDDLALLSMMGMLAAAHLALTGRPELPELPELLDPIEHGGKATGLTAKPPAQAKAGIRPVAT